MFEIDPSRAIGAYAAVMTAVAAYLVLGAATSAPTRFGTIDVRRINVREDDGTLRMIIAGRDHIGGIVIGNREYPHPNRTEAGMIFFNDEGAENGGLVFNGKVIAGKPVNAGSLTFDRWHQDQTIQITSEEDGASRHAGFIVNDRPDQPMRFDQIGALGAMKAGPAKDAAVRDAGMIGTQRVYLGSNIDRSAELSLRDAEGRKRLVFRVEPAGSPSITFLDEKGRSVSRIAPSR
ncbi:hypothetical protein [Sphingomonas sp. PAMC 26621]|uniref:hypothetical protein n=1 Tax=Sphingomonas sp. PAMC 26621 TaxID=1112213 RepID=UPI0002897099|nr:hypothetical protein [Sphingomonas sp. PAMC 26621]